MNNPSFFSKQELDNLRAELNTDFNRYSCIGLTENEINLKRIRLNQIALRMTELHKELKYY